MAHLANLRRRLAGMRLALQLLRQACPSGQHSSRPRSPAKQVMFTWCDVEFTFLSSNTLLLCKTLIQKKPHWRASTCFLGLLSTKHCMLCFPH